MTASLRYVLIVVFALTLAVVPASTAQETTPEVPVPTETPTNVPTATPTETATQVPTATLTETATQAPTATLTEAPTSTETQTSTLFPTDTVTPPTATNTEQPTFEIAAVGGSQESLVTVQTSANLTFIGDFDTTPLEFFERRDENPDITGVPNPAFITSGVSMPPVIEGNYAATQIIVRSTPVDMQLSVTVDFGGETHSVVDFGWGMTWRADPLDDLSGRFFESYIQYRDLNGNILGTSNKCSMPAETGGPCNVNFPYFGSDVASVTVYLEETGMTTTGFFQFIIDTVRIQTGTIISDATSTPASTSTPTPTPIFITNTPVASPTATPLPTRSIWWVTEHNLRDCSNPDPYCHLVVREEPTSLSNEIGGAPSCSSVERAGTDTYYNDPNSQVVYVPIYWPQGSSTIAYIAISDGAFPQDGDYLVPNYADLIALGGNCPDPQPSPTPTLTPTPTPTPIDPSIPIVNPGRFGQPSPLSGWDVIFASAFADDGPATVGNCAIHIPRCNRNYESVINMGLIVDILPRQLEHCFEDRNCTPETQNGGPIPVYSPVKGGLVWDGDTVTIYFNSEARAIDIGVGEDVRREVVFAHIVPLDIFTAHVSHGIEAGALIGYVDNEQHVDFQLRWYGVSGRYYRPTEEELLGVITAGGQCLYDDWLLNSNDGMVLAYDSLPPDDPDLALRVRACPG